MSEIPWDGHRGQSGFGESSNPDGCHAPVKQIESQMMIEHKVMD